MSTNTIDEKIRIVDLESGDETVKITDSSHVMMIDSQSGIANIGRKLVSIAMILQKGTSSLSVQIPFTWSSGSFAVTLYGLLGNRITAGSANVTSYYYGFAM
jgi:hypothetical protein